jgi:arylsulfatase B
MGHDEPDYDANNPIVRGGQPVVEESYLTDAFTREGVSFIDRHADKPFFLYLAYNAVHSPLQGADRYMEKFAHLEDMHRRIFAAMLANLDESVGEVLKAVRHNQLEERTLIFFLSDNGGPTRELTSSNAPLRGEKGSMYEGGLRVPFLVQWRGTLPAGTVEDRMIASVDIFPTVTGLAGAEVPSDLDGKDLMPYLRDGMAGNPHDTFFWRQGARNAYRSGDWKLVNMTRDATKPKWELYNIADDLAETRDVAADEPDRLRRMTEEWAEWNGQMREPLFR